MNYPQHIIMYDQLSIVHYEAKGEDVRKNAKKTQVLHLAASLYQLLLAFGLCPDGSSEAEMDRVVFELECFFFSQNVILPSMNQPRGSSYLHKRESESDFSCLDGLCYLVLVCDKCAPLFERNGSGDLLCGTWP